jgi:hypothetical protein
VGGWAPTGEEGYLGLTDGIDRMVADEVVQKADELWHERINSIMKAIEVAVQNGVARAFSG